MWTQILSDVCGVEQDLPNVTVGAAYGDALLAAQVAGLADASTVWAKIATTVRPNPDNKQRYDDLYGRYRELYPATKEIQHYLAGMDDASA